MWHITCMHPLYMYVRYLEYTIFMPNLVGILVSGIFFAIRYEVEAGIGCVLVYVGSTCPFSLLAVCNICNVAGIMLLSSCLVIEVIVVSIVW